MKKITALILTAVLSLSVLSIGCPAAEEGNLLANGDFETKPSASSDWSLYSMDWVEDADGNNYAKATVGGGNFRLIQYVKGLESETSYRLSFRMRSSKKDALYLNGLRDYIGGMFYSDSDFVNKVGTGRSTDIYFGAVAYTGEDIQWRNYSVDIPVPKTAVAMRLYFWCVDDAEFAIDDIRLEKTGPANYVMNGDFELGFSGWTEHGASPGGIAVDEATGNMYFNRTSTSYSSYIRNNFTLPAGRFKISFKAKTVNAGDRISVNLYGDKDGSTDTAATGHYLDFYSGKAASCNALTTGTEWQTFNFYVTLPAAQNVYLALPTARWGQSSMVSAAHFDDVSITKDESWIDFASYEYQNLNNSDHSFVLVKSGESLSSLPASGGTIPVAAHLVPEQTEISQSYMMVSSLYKIGSMGEKVLVDVSVKTGATDLSEATQNGQNAMATVNFIDSLTCPDDSEGSFVAEVMLWDSPDAMHPYRTEKIVLTK